MGFCVGKNNIRKCLLIHITCKKKQNVSITRTNLISDLYYNTFTTTAFKFCINITVYPEIITSANFSINTSVKISVYTVINIHIDFIFGIFIGTTLLPTSNPILSPTLSPTSMSNSSPMSLPNPKPNILPTPQPKLTLTFLLILIMYKILLSYRRIGLISQWIFSDQPITP